MINSAKMLLVVLSLVPALFLGSNAYAQSDVSGGVNSLINSITSKVGNAGQFAQVFCRKGALMSGVFSVRSAKGIACKNKTVAAMAEKMCTEGNVDNYAESDCHRHAQQALAGTTADDALTTAIANRDGPAMSLICKMKAKLPAALSKFATKCQ